MPDFDPADISPLCPIYAPFFGTMGCMAATTLTCIGAAWGTSKAGVGIASAGILRPEMLTVLMMPTIMAGIVGIYGLVVSIIMSNYITDPMPLSTGFIQLGAGLTVGLAGLSAGICIGIVGDAGVRGAVQQPKIFTGMILIMIFGEVLGIYGLIIALNLLSKAEGAPRCLP
ncbi:V-type proton ATPase proteolipid subunit [Meredithblackwellia eburnea MCA 4105]